MRRGWMGRMDQLLYYLDVVGADRDESGRPMIWGHVTVGMGGDEVIVEADACYSVDGRKCGLADGLLDTSGGVGVAVFS